MNVVFGVCVFYEILDFQSAGKRSATSLTLELNCSLETGLFMVDVPLS